MDDREPCFSCGGRFSRRDGPTHPYMLSTPGCWAAYGTLLAREYEAPALFGAVHRLSVDAYALQHPGDPSDRRARQSVWVHYAGLVLALDRGTPHARIPRVMQALTRRDPPPLPPRPGRFAVTHEAVLAAGPRDHARLVRDWAACAFASWSALRDPVGAMLDAL